MSEPNQGVLSPIQTRRNGFHFRSRLEARWSVFFDAMGIGFQYELDAFRFNDGTCYLPDFFLPQVRMWAEVKPIELSEAERHRARELSRATNWPIILLVEPPNFRFYEATIWVPENAWEISFVSLDIDRFWHEQPPLPDCSFSDRYQDAVYEARGARFSAE